MLLTNIRLIYVTVLEILNLQLVKYLELTFLIVIKGNSDVLYVD